MKTKYKIVLFVVSLTGLIVLQAKVILPIVYDVIASDLFLEDSGDDANYYNTAATDMTGYAFDQCNFYIANDLDSDIVVSFTSQPVNAWNLGNFQYVINADIDIMPENAAAFTRRYVCRIKYDNGNDPSGAANSDNWSIDGISGLDDL
ncbi:hypothetical protein Q9L42_006560 [Methylomarinum sp. Ch1-1]|uniref:Uncharacterized protein n=1 Tax=Methylomarinum roseum TaxID=3067653 RepID=A0AAU7NXL9_9GAMM|nr:hypothetical protein [Methylomarinum sp. Ch1-1]MDP4522121.1 hypothetical protein [Methylomarinum sp. Ch1-1]